MHKTRKHLLLSAAAAAFVAVASYAPRADAQEIQLTGPLAGAPAVRKLRLYREGRIDIEPSVSFTLLDEYRRTIIPGATLQYNVTDYLGVGVWGGYGVISLATDLTDQIDSTAARNSRTAPNVNHSGTDAASFAKGPSFADQTAKLTYFIAPQAQFAPFRGKLAIFQKFFVDTDLYVHGGLILVGVQERGSCGFEGKPACTDPKSFALESRTAVAPTFGLGLSFYTSNLLSFRLEYRAFPFSWNRPGFDQRGSGNNAKAPDNKVDGEDQTFKFNQMITLGVGISLPGQPKTSD